MALANAGRLAQWRENELVTAIRVRIPAILSAEWIAAHRQAAPQTQPITHPASRGSRGKRQGEMKMGNDIQAIIEDGQMWADGWRIEAAANEATNEHGNPIGATWQECDDEQVTIWVSENGQPWVANYQG